MLPQLTFVPVSDSQVPLTAESDVNRVRPTMPCLTPLEARVSQ